MSAEMNRIVGRMEHIREEMEECETAVERKRLGDEYRLLSAILTRAVSGRTAPGDATAKPSKTGNSGMNS